MLVTDFRQTRVYQEAHEAGREEVALRLIESDYPIAEIVRLTKLSAAKIRKLKKEQEEGRAQVRAEVALRLIELGWSIAKIADVTELSPAKIRKLKKEAKASNHVV